MMPVPMTASQAEFLVVARFRFRNRSMISVPPSRIRANLAAGAGAGQPEGLVTVRCHWRYLRLTFKLNHNRLG